MPFPGRHRFQVGPSTFSLKQAPDGWWWVLEVYWQMRNADDKEDVCETHGPFTMAEADATWVRLKSERERRA